MTWVALLLIALFMYYLFTGTHGKASSQENSGSTGHRPTARDTKEVARLHAELKRMVLGDEKRVKRLVDHERRPGLSRADCYREAISRLVRDRS